MRSNFSFLSEYWPDLAQIGSTAESYLYTDPNACIYKLGMLGERMAVEILRLEKLPVLEETTQADRIRQMKRADLLPRKIDDIFFALRKARNEAVHAGGNSGEKAATLLRMSFHLCCWFMEVYGDWSFQAPAFQEPEDTSNEPDFQQQLQLQEERIQALSEQIEEIRKSTGPAAEPKEMRARRAEEAFSRMELTESENNYLLAEQVRLEISMLPVVNYALQQNGIPIVQTVTVCNRSAEALEDLELQISASHDLSLPYAKHIAYLPPESEVEVTGIKIQINGEALSALTERLTGSMRFTLVHEGTMLYEETAELTMLAYDEWHGSAIYPEMLCAFVTPNHPEVVKISTRASDFLNRWTGDPSQDGYHSQDPNRVLQQAAAVYAAFQEQNIVYSVPPASFEKAGQRVRLCDAVMQQKMGTCLDLSLFYASVLEAMGLHPILILQKGHIFTGVWLEELTLAEPVQDDVSLITKHMASGISEMAAVECTAFVAGKKISFQEACDLASRNLNNIEDTEYIIDVHRARMSGVKPLPVRVQTENGWRVETPERKEEELTAAPDAIGGIVVLDEAKQGEPLTKKMQWERKLLDLGMRNALINLRLSKSMIPVLTTSLDELEDCLADGSDFSIHPRPTDWKTVQEASFETLHDLGEIAPVIQSEFKNKRLRSSLTEGELAKAIKDLYRSAKKDLEENGANTLYLALGLLRWYENPRSQKARYAPLIMIPVELVRRSVAQGYVIRLRDDDPQMNITMLEKLKQDFKIEIGGLDPLPQDEHGIDTRKVFTIIRKKVMGQKNWDVLESAYLGIFSFSQFVMWNDIRNRADDLARNKIVQSLMDGHLAWNAESMTMGDKVSEDDVLLPIPADASQLFAIKAASKGESFVLHGPPGTGKSQTITAMIANALAQGKTVLFVAEKMAALEVVQKRLEKIGIGDFCLELHSNKSKKKDVLAQLQRASEVIKRSSPKQFAQQAETIAALRRELDAYVDALHAPQTCGRSLYFLINHYESVFDAPDLTPFPVEWLRSQDQGAIDAQELLVERLVTAAQAVGHPQDHPLTPVTQTEYVIDLREQLREAVPVYRHTLEETDAALDPVLTSIGEAKPASFGTLCGLFDRLRELEIWLEVPGEWAPLQEPDLPLHKVQELANHSIAALDAFDNIQDVWQLRDRLRERLREINDGFHAVMNEMDEKLSAASIAMGRTAPKQLTEYLSAVELSGELLRWKQWPKEWSGTDHPGRAVTELQDMAAHFLTAEKTRGELSEIWKDEFLEQDGSALAEEYMTLSSKFVLTRSLGLGKMVKRLSFYAKKPLSKEMLGPQLSALVGYQTEKRAGESAMENCGDLLGAWYDGSRTDWQMIYDGALQAAQSLKTLSSRFQADEKVLRKSAGNGQWGMLQEIQDVWERFLSYRADWNGFLSIQGNEEEKLTTLVRINGLVSENLDVFTDWSFWRGLAKSADVEGAPVFHSISEILRKQLPQEASELFRVRKTQSGLSGGELPERGVSQRYFERTAEYIRERDMVRQLMPDCEPLLASPVPKTAHDWLRIHGLAEKARASADRLASIDGGNQMRIRFGSRRELSDGVIAVNRVSERLVAERERLCSLLAIQEKPADKPWVSEQIRFCDALIRNESILKEWILFRQICGEAENVGLSPVVQAYWDGVAHDQVKRAWQKALSKGLILEAIRDCPDLGKFSGLMFSEKIEQLKRMDSEYTKLTQEEIYCRLASRIPDFSREAHRSSEVGILQKAIRSGGRGVSLRNLFEQIPNILPRICPCMLMSPISAAQYLTPDRAPFDVVVFDEASQLPTCKAVGALARGENAVIVGDPKQMPPTSFFASNQVDEENLDTEDLESILDDCLALNIPDTHLQWHYRSRHESLIAFSNQQFYESKLYTFPSVNDRERKVRLEHVDGVFDRGRSRQNRQEAEAVIRELKRRCHSPMESGYSVGVVTFNITQQNLIDDLLTEACQTDSDLENWAYHSEEPIFIKNLENVQGDERDVILFSVGYGPDRTGKVSMNFGPLNRSGGWRRLNVAVTRARCEMIVYSTLLPEQIELSRTSAEGVAALRAFLEYAAGRRLSLNADTVGYDQKERDEEGIADAICEQLKQHGYRADLMVGHSEFRIDIAVVDPEDENRYLLGILLDGQSYRAAKTTRDRELAQAGVLSDLGWALIRVWTMDWFENKEKEVERILTELKNQEEKREQPAESAMDSVEMQETEVASLWSEEPAEVPEMPRFQTGGKNAIPAEDFQKMNRIAAPAAAAEAERESAPGQERKSGEVETYREAKLPVRSVSNEAFFERYMERAIKDAVHLVIQEEGPVSEGTLIRRVVQSCGIKRAGSRIHGHMVYMLSKMDLKTTQQAEDTFYWAQTQQPDSYWDIRANGEESAKRDVREIAVEEAANAIYYVLFHQVSLPLVDALREAAKLMGFTRMGGNVVAAFRSAEEYGEKKGFVEKDGKGFCVLTEEGMKRAETLAQKISGRSSR